MVRRVGTIGTVTVLLLFVLWPSLSHAAALEISSPGLSFTVGGVTATINPFDVITDIEPPYLFDQVPDPASFTVDSSPFNASGTGVLPLDFGGILLQVTFSLTVGDDLLCCPSPGMGFGNDALGPIYPGGNSPIWFFSIRESEYYRVLETGTVSGSGAFLDFDLTPVPEPGLLPVLLFLAVIFLLVRALKSANRNFS
jgi:hypothetical protein